MSIPPVSMQSSKRILFLDPPSQKIEEKVECVAKRSFSKAGNGESKNNQIIYSDIFNSANSYEMPPNPVKKRRDDEKDEPPIEFSPKGSSRRAMAQTPMKKRKQNVLTPLMNTCGQIARGKLERSGHTYKLVANSDARGDYKQLYAISDEQPQLIVGYDNCKVRIKALHEYCLNRSTPEVAQDFWKKSCESQIGLQNLGFPVAQILNSSLEDGYEIVVYICNAIDPNKWAGNMPIASLDTDLVFLLKQARDILTRAAKENLLLDLSPNNFRVNDDNELFIIDSFVEEDPLDSFLNDPNTTIQCWLKSALVNWANENPYVYAFLTEDIGKMNAAASKELAIFA